MAGKTLYLHIGFGKTGTSYIQSSLAANREKLRQYGVHYPALYERDLGKYGMINSGNGTLLAKLLNPDLQALPNLKLNTEQSWAKLKSEILGTDCDRILLSAEQLQAAKEEHLIDFADFLKNNNCKSIQVIAFVRSFLEHTFSRWGQGLKRQGKTTEWENQCSIAKVHFLNTLQIFENVFGTENIRVLNYDRRKDNLFNSFLEILPTPPLEPCQADQVNRSLSARELSIMLHINRKSEERNSNLARTIATTVSDMMVEVDQEKPYRDIIQSKQAWESFTENNKATLEELNRRYLDNEPVKMSLKDPVFGIMELPELTDAEKHVLDSIHSTFLNIDTGSMLDPHKVAEMNKASLYILSARVFIHQKQFENALWTAEKALEKAPGEPRAYFEMARSYENMADLVSAKEAVSKALAIWPSKEQYLNYLNRLEGKSPVSSLAVNNAFTRGVIFMDNNFSDQRSYMFIRTKLKILKDKLC